MQDFHQKLRKLGRDPTSDTICLENTRLGDKYLIFDLLAVGRHSTIYYGIEEATRKQRVFKFYNLRQLQNTRSFKEKELCKRLSNCEYSLARKCDSIHILHPYDIYEDRATKIIVTEYCNLGSLASEISARKSQGIEQLKAIAILKQVVTALKNIHKNCGILHKNLKAKNVLIQDGIYKLIDFGLPTVNIQEEQEALRVPEIIMKKGYDQKAEVWSLGVLFYQILFGQLPNALRYNTKNYLISSEVKTIFENSNEKIHYDDEVRHFLEQCLRTNPLERMTWKKLEQHSIFQLILPQVPRKISTPVPHENDRISVIIVINEEDSIPELSEGQQRSLEPQAEVDEAFYKGTFNLEQQVRALDKQIEQSYEKLGNYLELKVLQPVSWEPLRRGIDKKEHEQYQQFQHYYLQCLKVDFVYYDIISILQKIPDFAESRQYVEFMYLMFSRCFFQMSQLHVITQKGFQSRAQNVLVACIKRQTDTLYTKIKTGWEGLCKKMQCQQSQIINRVFDKFSSLFNKSNYNRKNELLTGIEGPDFTKEEQIQFTLKIYQEHVRKELPEQLRQLKQKIGNFDDMMLVRFLDKYEQMWKIQKLDERFLSVKHHMFAICQIE